jgi:hypothetical protein
MKKAEENEELSDEENNSTCAKCGTTPDDVLLLTCEHNLCLPCATKNLQREGSKSKNNLHVTKPHPF